MKISNQKATSRQNDRKKTRKLAITGMLGAITIMLGFTPLGMIPIGVFNVTTLHIPVIIGAIMEGPVVGASVGLIFGVTSLIKNLTAPTPISFIFWNPIVSVVPRILIGVLSYYFYSFAKRMIKNEKVSSFLTGIVGTFVNTFFVLSFAYLLYAKDLVAKLELPDGAGAFLIGIATANGIPEMLMSALITVSVVTAVKKIK